VYFLQLVEKNVHGFFLDSAIPMPWISNGFQFQWPPVAKNDGASLFHTQLVESKGIQ